MFVSAKQVLAFLFPLLARINAQTCSAVTPPAGIAPGTSQICCAYNVPVNTITPFHLATCAQLEALHGLTIPELLALNPILNPLGVLSPLSTLISEATCTTALQALLVAGHHYAFVLSDSS
jgi:hypothetical protein